MQNSLSRHLKMKGMKKIAQKNKSIEGSWMVFVCFEYVCRLSWGRYKARQKKIMIRVVMGITEGRISQREMGETTEKIQKIITFFYCQQKQVFLSVHFNSDEISLALKKKKKVLPQEAQPLESKNKYIILVSLLIQSDHFLLLAQIIIVRFYEILFLKQPAFHKDKRVDSLVFKIQHSAYAKY